MSLLDSLSYEILYWLRELHHSGTLDRLWAAIQILVIFPAILAGSMLVHDLFVAWWRK